MKNPTLKKPIDIDLFSVGSRLLLMAIVLLDACYSSSRPGIGIDPADASLRTDWGAENDEDSQLEQDEAADPEDDAVDIIEGEESSIALDVAEDETECTPDCFGKQCGPDGCGGICPPGCSGSEFCNDATGLCEVLLVQVEYAYNFCACMGLAWMEPGSVFEIYNEPGGGPGNDVARCYLGHDNRLRAYNLDSIATEPVWGEAVEVGCSTATFISYIVQCCFH